MAPDDPPPCRGCPQNPQFRGQNAVKPPEKRQKWFLKPRTAAPQPPIRPPTAPVPVPETLNDPTLPDPDLQQDLFIYDVADAVLKDVMQQLEPPFYSLSKKLVTSVREYHHGDHWLRITPSVTGLATIYTRTSANSTQETGEEGTTPPAPFDKLILRQAQEQAASAATHAFTSGYVSARKAPSEPQDQLCGHHIARGNEAALRTAMHTNGQS